ncbi:uncharacterized protein H6S33_008673 [Morchella sextelata]|uniref:uncharacterized protein n=1 Tax=Morchella sextelata TaxID=1174677 RepID=UPI001D044094|nr:uncharacterized protein H6S33_008673 [Morchella sextelata]KAH0602592.1 hypothetical protein H6S33_008673 [Morchella sextelata]
MSPAVTLPRLQTKPTTCCPNCGADAQEFADARRRIAELEAQVRLLSDKATSAVDKLADYEDEVRKRSISSASSGRDTMGSNASPPLTRPTSSPSQMPVPPPALNRISAFLSAATTRRGAPPPSPPPEEAVNEPLEKERRLRLKAEERLDQVTEELEDLSATLFQQANEMVATERRERAKLEERIAVLEGREVKTKERLGLLERAVDRAGRVREVLAEGQRTTSMPPSMPGRGLGISL